MTSQSRLYTTFILEELLHTITIIMIAILTSIIQIHMTMKTKTKSILLLSITLLAGCAISPGMSSPNMSNSSQSDGIEIINIDSDIVFEKSLGVENYLVSTGDVLSIVVFGQNEFFPVVNGSGNNPYTSRLVDQNGEIFFSLRRNSKGFRQNI